MVFKKMLWFLFVLLAVLMGVYPFILYVLNIPFGITTIKSVVTMAKDDWKIAFNTHIVLGSVAILIGWIQFIPSWRQRNWKFHRILGLVYLFAVVVSSVAGVFISFYANGGISAFIALLLASLCWLTITSMAYYFILRRNIILHRKLMVYSYALTFAGVTLRLWLPTLAVALNSFERAYDLATWLAWVLNLLVAYYINESRYGRRVRQVY